MILNKHQILSAQDIKTVEVNVPEWGGAVLVRGLNGRERDQFEAASVLIEGNTAQARFENIRARLVAASVIDENGGRLFSDADVQALGEKSGAALDRVFSAAQRLSGLGKDDVQELAKN